MKKINLEKDWQKWLIARFEGEGSHIVLLPDDNKRSQSGSVGTTAREAGSKPYDFGMLASGIYMGVECKMVKGPTLYSTDIRPCQHDGLTEVGQCGGAPLIAVYFKFKVGKEVNEAGFVTQYLDRDDNYTYSNLMDQASQGPSGGVMCVTYGGVLDMSQAQDQLFRTLYPKVRAQYKYDDYVKGIMLNLLSVTEDQYISMLEEYNKANNNDFK